MKELIISTADESLKISGSLLKLIKDMKKAVMKKFLGIDENSDIISEYESGFSSCSWKTVKLSELVKSGGIAQGPREKSYYDSLYSDTGCPLILPEHIKSLRFMPDKFRFINKDAALNNEQYTITGGDIIMLTAGDKAGASALIPFMHESSMLGSGLMRIRPHTDRCEVFYLLNVLHFFYNAGIMKHLLENSAKHLTIPVISEMPVPLPPVKKQKEIAETMLQLSGGMAAQEIYISEMHGFQKLVKGL